MISDYVVSIIVPVYNRLEHLDDCFRSVEKQTYGNYELILIDDGSTDGSAEYCRRYAESDRRVVYIQGEHCGVSAARNKGLDIARGITFSFWIVMTVYIRSCLRLCLKAFPRAMRL